MYIHVPPQFGAQPVMTVSSIPVMHHNFISKFISSLGKPRKEVDVIFFFFFFAL